MRLTVNETSQQLGLPPQTIYAAIRAGRLRVQRKPEILINPEDVANCWRGRVGFYLNGNFIRPNSPIYKEWMRCLGGSTDIDREQEQDAFPEQDSGQWGASCGRQTGLPTGKRAASSRSIKDLPNKGLQRKHGVKLEKRVLAKDGDPLTAEGEALMKLFSERAND